MNIKIKNLLALPVVIIFAIVVIVMLANDNFEHFEDTNGADVYSLQTITDENIINMDIGSKGVWEKTNNITKAKTYSSEEFSGVYEINNTNFWGETFQVFVKDFKLNSGNIKFVVLVNDEIVHEFTPNQPNQVYEVEASEGTISLRIAGESADFEIIT